MKIDHFNTCQCLGVLALVAFMVAATGCHSTQSLMTNYPKTDFTEADLPVKDIKGPVTKIKSSLFRIKKVEESDSVKRIPRHTFTISMDKNGYQQKFISH